MSEQAKARKLRKKMMITMIFVVFALLMVVICAIGGAFNFHKGTNVMPNVVGMTEEEAVAAIEKLDAAASVSYQYDDQVLEGVVISQGVETGASVQHHSNVAIVVSRGPEEKEESTASNSVTLPNLVGLSMELAEKTAEQLGVLIVEDGSVNDDYIPSGSVAEQSPEGGTVVEPHSVVRVKLSAGPKVVYYTISVDCGPGGSVVPDGSTITRAEGEDVTIQIVPDEGYEVDVLIVDGEEVNPMTEYHFLSLDSNHSLTVTFKQKSMGLGGLFEHFFGGGGGGGFGWP